MNELNVIESDEKTALTPMTLINMAVSQGADVDKLEQLMGLQERWEKNEARKAYVSAISAFKSDPPDIYKTKLVAFGNTRYKHALIGDVNAIIIDCLTKHGLSHRWEVDQSNGITVSCIITHSMGHSELTKMTAPSDTSGQKNSIQAIASTITYLQRYTLLAATGLTTKDMPDDDAMGGVKSPIKSKEQKVKEQLYHGKDFTAELNAAKSLAELGEIWKNIPNKADYEALKDEIKTKLTEDDPL
jgi:hypothetical protein